MRMSANLRCWPQPVCEPRGEKLQTTEAKGVMPQPMARMRPDTLQGHPTRVAVHHPEMGRLLPTPYGVVDVSLMPSNGWISSCSKSILTP